MFDLDAITSGQGASPGDATDDFGAADLGAAAPIPGSGGSGASDDFNPSIHVGRDSRNADGSYRRKRGRRSGTATAPRSATKNKGTNQAGVEAVCNVLILLHAGIASATKFEDFALDNDEATTLATATVNVLNELDIQPDPKAVAIIGLMGAMGSIYGPRIYLYKEHLKAKKNKGEVVSLRPVNGSTSVFDPAAHGIIPADNLEN